MMVRGSICRLLLGVLLLGNPGVLPAEEATPPGTAEEVEQLLEAERYEEAERLARELLASAEDEHGEVSKEVAEALDLLLEVRWSWHPRERRPDVADSVANAERLAGVLEKIHGPEDPELLTGLDWLGTSLSRAEDYQGARRVYERSLKIRQAAFGPESKEVTRSLYGLGWVSYKEYDFETARTIYRRALEVREKALGPDHPDVARNLEALSGMLALTGRMAESIPLVEHALAIREKALGPDHPGLARALRHLSGNLGSVGDSAEAIPYAERALAICEKGLGPDHPEVAQSLEQLGELLMGIGDYERARVMFERSVAISEGTHGPDSSDMIGNLQQMAWFHMETGDPETALPLLERALKIAGKSYEPDSLMMGSVRLFLAKARLEVGDRAGARVLLEQVLANKAWMADPLGGAVALEISAGLHQDSGEYEAARDAFQRALAAKEAWFGESHPEVARGLPDYALLLARMGKRAEAFDSALRAEEIGREHARLTAEALPERQALRHAATRASGLDLILSLAATDSAKVPGIVRRAWDALIRSRALVLDQMAARHHTVAEAHRIAAIAQQLASASQRLANLTVRGPGGLPREQYLRLLDEARKEKEEAERGLGRMSVFFREQSSLAHIGFAEMAAALPPRSALVGYARYARHDLEKGDPAKGLRREPADSYLAFVLRGPEEEPGVTDLGAGEEIDALVSAWKKEVLDGVLGGPEGSEEKAGEALRKKIWDPLLAHLEGVERVFVVPDGALHLVSLGALPAGEGTWLLEGALRIHYLSAERDLAPSAEMESEGKGLLVLGDPAFEERSLYAALAPKADEAEEEGLVARVASLLPFRGERSGCGDFNSLRFEPLPATEEEAAELAALWGKKEGDKRPMGEASRLTGPAASEAAFKTQAPGKRVLHLATHGFFLGGSCESALGPTRGISSTSIRPTQGPPPVTGENPLLLAGLAMAGANNRDAAGPDEEDGILTAEEIASLDLSGVEWAVLSACETGVGEIQAGEGVFGLRRAFEVAGVDTLIMSLWSVEDEATREWMRHLYEARFVEGRDTAESVREAGLRVLKRRREEGESTHPFYWAAFVAAGEWK